MKRTAKVMSPALQLLTIVWDNVCTKTSFSWDRVNHSMSNALALAIASGMEFGVEDFGYIADKFNWWRWAGNSIGNHTGEYYYGLAVIEGNISACKAFEMHYGRTPFVCDDVDTCSRSWLTKGHGDSKRGRAAVGFRFPWKGVVVEVTSFAADGSYLTACTYKPKPPTTTCEHCGGTDWHKTSYARAKIDKRYKITVDDIRKERASKRGIRP